MLEKCFPIGEISLERYCREREAMGNVSVLGGGNASAIIALGL